MKENLSLSSDLTAYPTLYSIQAKSETNPYSAKFYLSPNKIPIQSLHVAYDYCRGEIVSFLQQLSELEQKSFSVEEKQVTQVCVDCLAGTFSKQELDVFLQKMQERN